MVNWGVARGAAGKGLPGIEETRTWLGLVAVGAMVAALLIGGASPAQAAPPALIRDSPTSTPAAMAVAAGITYVGGDFTSAGAATGPGAAVDSTAAVVDRRFPVVEDNSQVAAVAADGAGGYYLGGSFSSLNGVPRALVAHVLADGTLDPMWKPIVTGTAGRTVYSLLVAGSTVYLGGAFTQVNGTIRNRVAAVDATTGALLAWNPNAVAGAVYAMAISGSTVYLGGNFPMVNGNVTRRFAAAVDASTGVATAWNPDFNSEVRALVVSGSTVFLGGSFTTVGGQARNRAAAVDASTGIATSWNPDLDLAVQALVVSGSTVYLGGSFTTVGGQARNRAASVDASTGVVTAWDPNLNGSVMTMVLSGPTMYLGGSFSGVNSINGTLTRNKAAAVNATSGTVDAAWNPSIGVFTGSNVLALALSGATVYIGGSMRHTNVVTRNRAAAFDSDGRLTGWDPNVSGMVHALAVSGSTVYLAGAFSGSMAINGNALRNRAAAVDATSGAVTPWNPNVNDTVTAVAVAGSTVYLGGRFFGTSAMNGNVTRNRLAAVDATSGSVTAWDPNVGGAFPQLVQTLAISGSTMYFGGTFTSVGGQVRNRAASVDVATGVVTPWDPNVGGGVSALVVSGSTVYLAGSFAGPGALNGTVTRNRAAAVDATSGVVTGWDPNVGCAVSGLLVSGSTVYLGGCFTGAAAINGNVNRAYAAAVDASTGTVTGWNPGVTGGSVAAMALSGSSVVLGGAFTSVTSNTTQSGTHYLASLAASGANPLQVLNPAVSGSLLTWTPPRFGGISNYYVMYRPVGSAQPWAIYAAGVNNTGVSLTNPGARNTCSAANTAMGWTSCPMVRGWNPGTTYQFAIYPKTTEGKTAAGPLTTQISRLAS